MLNIVIGRGGGLEPSFVANVTSYFVTFIRILQNLYFAFFLFRTILDEIYEHKNASPFEKSCYALLKFLGQSRLFPKKTGSY